MLVATVGRDRADDCFQETVLAALRGYPELRDDSNLRSWFLTIAARKAIDEHRSAGRRPVPVADAAALEPADSAGPAAPSSENDGAVWKMVAELPAKQRAALALRYVADCRYAEIARALDCSDAAARRSVHEGLKTLRTRINGGRT